MVQLLAGGIPDLATKLPIIVQFIREGCQDPDIRALAAEILGAAGPSQVSYREPATVLSAFFGWAKGYVQFVPDPLSGQSADLGGVTVQGPVDLIQNAAATLERRAGDCVALTILLGSLVCAGGFPVQLGTQDLQGQGTDHVLLLVGLPAASPQQWVPVDLTTDAPGQLRPAFGPVQRVPI